MNGAFLFLSRNYLAQLKLFCNLFSFRIIAHMDVKLILKENPQNMSQIYSI